jgi:hypothetical protein
MSYSWNIAVAVAEALAAEADFIGRFTAAASFDTTEKLPDLAAGAVVTVYPGEIGEDYIGRVRVAEGHSVRVGLRERPAEAIEFDDAWMAARLSLLEEIRDFCRHKTLTLSGGEKIVVKKCEIPISWEPTHRREFRQYTGLVLLTVELVR